ncbi:hypothetical protein KSF73_09865 [Burkholderiaceae bacterium DAT-1]|nr:hypothetical protein [Burkholderiaceae bacterium DAT-1]
MNEGAALELPEAHPQADEQGDALIAAALAVLEARAAYSKDSQVFNRPDDFRAFFRLRLGMGEREEFHVAFLTHRHALISCETMFLGSLAQASVHPREVARRALQLNAGAVVCAHNHPSGDCSPSAADHRITDRLHAALDLVEIRLLDHFVVTAHDAVSLAEAGWHPRTVEF